MIAAPGGGYFGLYNGVFLLLLRSALRPPESHLLRDGVVTFVGVWRPLDRDASVVILDNGYCTAALRGAWSSDWVTGDQQTSGV